MTSAHESLKIILSASAQKKASRFVDWLVLQGVERTTASEAVLSFALDIAGKKPASASTEKNSRHSDALAHYFKLYESRYHEKPLLVEADHTALRDILKTASDAVVKERLEMFFSVDDKFISESGHKLTTLRSSWSRLVSLARRRRPMQATPYFDRDAELKR